MEKYSKIDKWTEDGGVKGRQREIEKVGEGERKRGIYWERGRKNVT